MPITMLDFIYNPQKVVSEKNYMQLKKESKELLLPPLKIMALFIALLGLFAMIFEVRYFSEYSIQIYLIRLSATLISFSVLVALHTRLGGRISIFLVHTLLITIIASTGYMIYLIPSTLVLNTQIVGLMIFTSALFLSWDVKNQIMVAIYYNLLFASAILLSGNSIYFLPNLYESLLFVIVLSIISVVGSAVNFRLRNLLAEKSYFVALSQKKYKSIFDNSAEGLFQSSLDGEFITVNKALVNILGYDNEEELLSVNIKNDLYKYPEERQKLLKQIQEEGEIRNCRVTLKRKEGAEIVVRLNDRLVSDDKRGIYFEGNMQDITEQVKAETEREKAELALMEEKRKSDQLAKEATQSSIVKSQFLASMSHEIRTPMNGIIGYLSLIEMEAFENEEEMNQFVSSAKKSAESLLDIINDLLDLSKIEAGKMELASVDFNLSDIIDEAVSIILTKAKEKNLEVTREITEGSPLLLKGDNKRIRQILTNLLSNAIKFTENGSVRIKVMGEEEYNEACHFQVCIEDTGIGIQSSKLKTLFKPFVQVDTADTKKYGGTGLGLVICKEFVNMMGGDIWIESEYGVGTKIFFTLKLKSQEHQQYQREMDQLKRFELQLENSNKKLNSSDARKERARHKILLAEDNLINQKVAMRIINDAGYNCEVVSDGIMAIEAVKNNNFSLVLMDVQMPEMDGFVATATIRKLGNNKKNIPIIAITAHALAGDRERCLNAGMNDYITKPIVSENLIKAIDNLLDLQMTERPKSKTHSEETVSNAVFDFDHLEKVSMGDDLFQREVVSSFIEDIYLRYQRIESFLITSEFSKLMKEAHTIKGAGYSIGAKKVAEEALAVELTAKHNDLESSRERVKKLKLALDETKEILSGLLFDTVKE